MECNRIIDTDIVFPKTRVNLDYFEIWVYKLAKSGYGSIREIRALNAYEFMNLINYERFLDDYARAFRALNERGKK